MIAGAVEVVDATGKLPYSPVRDSRLHYRNPACQERGFDGSTVKTDGRPTTLRGQNTRALLESNWPIN